MVRAVVCVPHLRVADAAFNTDRTLEMARRASQLGAAVALFPELGISAYSNEDLFHQDALLDAVEENLARAVAASREFAQVLLVGAPLRFGAQLFNCAVVIHAGSVLGIVPKTLSAELPRVLREAAVHVGAGRSVLRGALSRGDGPLRQRPGLRGLQRRRLRAPRGDLRGPLGTHSAEHLRCARGRDGAGKPLGEQHHRGQGGVPPRPLRGAVGEVHRRVPVLRRRARRVDHRPRLGRPRADLREQRPARGVAAVRRTTSR